MVKKIKNPLAKKKETSLITSSFKSVSHPKFALLIQSHYRPKILKLMFDWYQEIALKLKDQLDLEIYLLQEQADIDLDALCVAHKINPILATTEMELGRKLNLALDHLKDKSIDALIYLKAGDLLSQGVFESYYDKLKNEDLLMVGLVDQYLYDATEGNFMYWSRDQHHQGLEKMGETGWLLSKDILNALDWKLWSNQSTHAPESTSKSLQKKLSEIFDRVKKGTCILSPLNQLNGFLISLKSELGRAIFDKVKWQNFKGLMRADFESTVDQKLSTQWIDRISDFDERLILDILIEEQFGDQLWLQHYNDCVYKFLPYAKVRLRLISKTPLNLSGNWSNWTYEAGQLPWQQAMALVSKEKGDAVLVAGRGGLVDFKTIEYYIIRMVEKNAKLMGLLNFYLINQKNQAYFWQGNRQVSFKQIFGFGLMIATSYLEALNWEIWDQNHRLSTQTAEKLDMLLAQNEAHKHVMYPCISHELTPIAILDDQGVFGFEGAFLMDELIPIQLYQRLPKGGYATTFEYKIKNWQNFINASSILQPKTTKTNSIAQDNPMTDQTLSPLEKAKALLAKAKSQTTASPTPVATPTQVQAQAPTIVPTSPQQSATSAELSPLEKAKALLAKAKAQNSSATAPTPAPTPILAQTPAPQAVNDEKLVQMQAQMQAQMQEALSLLNQVQAKLNPINPQVQFLCEQGENAFMAQNLTVAQQFFESALLIDPNHVDSLNNLAVLSQAQGNAWKALSFFLIALQIQPNHEITTENLIALLEKSPDLALAAKLILV